MGVFALSFLALLAQAGQASGTAQDVAVPVPDRPINVDPVVLDTVVAVADEPRFVAPTRRDRIGRIWAPVAVNGKGPYRLVLATGASHSALTPRLAEALGIRPNTAETIMLHGATGSMAVPIVPIETLEVGDLLMEPKQLPIIPDALGGADGVLGMEGLENKRIHIDFRHDSITIVRSKKQRAPAGYQTIPVNFLHGRLLIADANMGGVQVKAIIDTGGQASLGNLALRLALAERRRRQEAEGKLDQIIGSTLDMQVGTRLETPAITLGKLQVRNPGMTFADFAIFEHWKMTKEPAMLIGMDVLGLFDTLIIDYRRKELQVRLPRR